MSKREERLSMANRLREYRNNPHHINPMSERFSKLIGDAARELVLAAGQISPPVPTPNRSTVPWGVNTLTQMISSQVTTPLPDGRYVRAVPVAYHKNIRETVRAAWWVLTGRAEAVVWPQAGELEHALSGASEAGRSLAKP